MSAEKFGGYQDRSRIRERLALRIKVKSDKHLEIHGGLNEGRGMKTYLHGPTDFEKTLKLRFRVGNLNLSERRKKREEEEEVDAQVCPCSKTLESRTHIVGECEIWMRQKRR